MCGNVSGFDFDGVFCSLCRTQSGTFKDGDLRVNKDGVRIISQSEPEVVSLSSSSFGADFTEFRQVLGFDCSFGSGNEDFA